MSASVIEHKFGPDAKEAYSGAMDLTLNTLDLNRLHVKAVRKGVKRQVKKHGREFIGQRDGRANTTNL